MSEYNLHKAVVMYINMKYPKALYHSDLSGVKMSMGTIRKMAALNKYRGFPDLILYEKNMKYIGLVMELKKEGSSPFKKNGDLKTSEHLDNQVFWLNHLAKLGFKTSFVVGVPEAIKTIDDYFNNKL